MTIEEEMLQPPVDDDDAALYKAMAEDMEEQARVFEEAGAYLKARACRNIARHCDRMYKSLSDPVETGMIVTLRGLPGDIPDPLKEMGMSGVVTDKVLAEEEDPDSMVYWVRLFDFHDADGNASVRICTRNQLLL